MNLRFYAFIATMILACMVPSRQAEAGCGLDHCPIQSSTADEHSQEHSDELSIEIPLKFHVGGFNITAGQGNFTETTLGIIVALSPKTVIGAEAGWVDLNVNGETISGLGNPTTFVQYALLSGENVVLSLGTQLEWAMPSSPAAIASSHFELLPYASARYDHAEFYSTLRAGGRFALEGDDEHSHGDHTHLIPDAHGSATSNTQFVNGHNDTEFLYWANIGRQWNDALDTHAFVSGQVSLSNGSEGHSYGTVGLSGMTELFDLVEIHLAAEVPITEFRWFDWRSMGKASVQF